MPIKVQCQCGKVIAAPDSFAGKTAKCPACQQPLKIPAAGAAAPAPAAAKPAASAPKPAAAKPAAAKPAAPAAKAAPKPAVKTDPAANKETVRAMAKPGKKISKKFSKKINSARFGKPGMGKAARPADEEPVNEAPEEETYEDEENTAPAPETAAPADDDAAEYDDYEADSAAAESAADEESAADGEEEEQPEEGPVPVGLGKRFGALILDGIFSGILMFGVTALYMMLVLGDPANQAFSPNTAKEIATVAATADVAGSDTAAVKSSENATGADEKVAAAAVEAADKKSGAPGTPAAGFDASAQFDAMGMVMAYMGVIPVALAAQFAYFFLLEALLAATLGKLILGLRVCNKDNRKCSFVQALIRNLVKNIMGLISMIVALFTAKKQAVHDLAAGTYVIAKADLVVPAGHARKKPAAPNSKSRRGKKDEDAEEAEEDGEDTPAPKAKPALVGKKLGLPGKNPSLGVGKKPVLPGKKPGLPMKKVGKKLGMKK